MNTIQEWLRELKKQGTFDFVGIASNVAKENEPKEIRWLYVVGNQSEAYKKIRLQVGRGIAGTVWKTARTQLDENIFEHPEKLIEYPIARLEKLQVALATPVMEQGEVIAVLMIGCREERSFSSQRRDYLESVALELGSLLKEEGIND